MKYLLTSLFLTLLLSSCAQTKDEGPESWEAQLDSFIRDRNGTITFARTHYPVARTAAMNKARNIKTKKLMRKTCKPGVFKIISDKFIGTDFVTLRVDYRRNIQARVYEFRCVRK